MLLLPMYVVLSLYALFADGFVLAKLWLWYAVPLGAKPLHWHIFAVAMGAWWVLRGNAGNRKDDRSTKEQAQAVLLAFATPWVVLLIAWWWL